jgi:hypothetical protein
VPISVEAAVSAWNFPVPFFMPRLSNQPAVPGIFPPRKNFW